ncbi:MAG: S-layer homology domain-containing protein [Oscillospiraceae bacterium]|nr:S-layer homology domain-containing protein [Oscillospiraceae bacterium]
MKRYISMLLALVMLLTLFPLTAAADSSMQASENLKTLIKSYEGYREDAYLNEGEAYLTIGWGHSGPDVYVGMPMNPQIAEDLFNSDIKTFEDSVNKWNDQYKLNLNQNQFDALVSITYNFGAYWVEANSGDWRLANYVQSGFKDASGNRLPDLEIADAFGVLCSSARKILPGLITRRINEAEIFLYNNYHTDNTHFVYTILNPNGGTLASGNRVAIFYKDQPYGTLPAAVSASGQAPSYWAETDENGKPVTPITASTIANKNRSLIAVWNGGCALGDNCPSKKFTDITPDFWAHDAIDYVVSNNMFNGTTGTTFSPGVVMSRGMLVTVLYRLEGSPDVSGIENPFSDLADNAYHDAILWASDNRIANGWQDGTFGANGTLTREQLAVFLHRYANYKGYDTNNYSDIGGFSDAKDVGEFARESMCWAVGEGIINGTTATTLSPKTGANRAQVATMMMRFTGGML